LPPGYRLQAFVNVHQSSCSALFYPVPPRFWRAEATAVASTLFSRTMFRERFSFAFLASEIMHVAKVPSQAAVLVVPWIFLTNRSRGVNCRLIAN
jgi:hypothetical protein